MANNENAFQLDLRKAIMDAGGECLRIRTPYIAGIPDLLIKLPDYPAIMMECKYIKEVIDSKIRVDHALNMTTVQRNFMGAWAKAGMVVAWGLCAKHVGTSSGHTGSGVSTTSHLDIAAFGTNTELHYVDTAEFKIVKKYGKEWDIKLIMKELGL